MVAPAAPAQRVRDVVEPAVVARGSRARGRRRCAGRAPVAWSASSSTSPRTTTASLDLDRVAEASRAVSDALDAADAVAGRLHARGVEPRRRPPADRAPALRARASAALVTLTLADGGVAGRPAGGRRPWPATTPIVVVPGDARAQGPTPAVRRPGRGSRSTRSRDGARRGGRWRARPCGRRRRRARRRPDRPHGRRADDGHRHAGAAAARAREGDQPRRARRRDRAGAAVRLPPHAGRARATPGSSSTAQTGHVTVWAREARGRRGEAERRGGPCRRPSPTAPSSTTRPTGFGRIATATARQVIVQRLRDAEDDQVLGAVPRQGGRGPRRRHPAGPRPAHRARRRRRHRGGAAGARAGADRGRTCTASGSRALRARRRARPEGPADHAVAHAPEPRAQAVRARGARDRRRHRRDHGDGPRGRAPHQDGRARARSPGVNAKGACIGPMGARVRAVMAELHGEKIDIVDHSDDPAEFVAHALSPARVLSVDGRRRRGARGPRGRAGLPAVARDRQGGPERPPRREAHRLAHRHPLRRRGAPADAERPRATADGARPHGRRAGDRGAVDWLTAGPDARLSRRAGATPGHARTRRSAWVRCARAWGAGRRGPRSVLLRVVAVATAPGSLVLVVDVRPRAAGPGCVAAPRSWTASSSPSAGERSRGPCELQGRSDATRGARATSRQQQEQDVAGQFPAARPIVDTESGLEADGCPMSTTDEYPAMSTQH